MNILAAPIFPLTVAMRLVKAAYFLVFTVFLSLTLDAVRVLLSTLLSIRKAYSYPTQM